MDRFRRNYNFGRHAGIIAAFYGLLALMGNVVLFKRYLDKAKKEKQKENSGWVGQIGKRETIKAVACGYVKRPPKSVTIFNAVIGACFIADLCMYPVTKKWVKKL